MKKLLTILFLIMLIISFFQITSMFALYKEQLEGEYSTLLGVWAIKVNETDISSGGQNLTFNITEGQLGYVSSEYIQAGKIAPGGQAYFDIEIDPTNTDVSIIYKIDVESNATGIKITEITDEIDGTITTEKTELAQLSDVIELVKIENYFAQEDEGGEITNQTETTTISTEGQIVDPTTTTTVMKNGNSYTAVIPVDKITQGYKNYIRLYFKWKNVEANTNADKLIGETKDAKISIPLQINLKQYAGEVIGNES